MTKDKDFCVSDEVTVRDMIGNGYLCTAIAGQYFKK